MENLNQKICIIGYGYWGKILHKNLAQLHYRNIKILDIAHNNMNELDDTYDCYFVVTPLKTHFNILLQLSEFNNKKIWCEKPLVLSQTQCEVIYSEMDKNNNLLFVDWIYTFNPCVDRIKELISNENIKQIILNRTNDGPIRYDCSSIYDLSSHDISILHYIFDNKKFNFRWNEFSIYGRYNGGSNVSSYYKDGMQIIINSSWEHKFKNRISLFITETDNIILFNDSKKIIITEKYGLEDFNSYPSPIHLAINHFFNSDNFEFNKNITFKITGDLCNSMI
jgi:predicted dehydrogenase